MRFWIYVITALNRLHPGVGDMALTLLRSPQTPPIDSVLTLLLNALAALPGETILVLDDYHLIQTQSIHDALSFLLDHLPSTLHLIIASRLDPPLPLARLRAPFSSLSAPDSDHTESAVDPDRFQLAGHQLPGHWISFPSSWQELPEDHLLSQETQACLVQAIQVLPPNQREIIILRDIDGWTSEEACGFLGISEAYQRVLLHRAHSKVRGMLEKYFEEE